MLGLVLSMTHLHSGELIYEVCSHAALLVLVNEADVVKGALLDEVNFELA